jgi:RHS repeat-associated protein
MKACAAAAPDADVFRLVGDPIDVVTGRVQDYARDFRLIGPLPFEWTRYYDSGDNDTVRSLGHGHAHGYDWRLFYDVDGLSVESPAGRRTGFGAMREGEHEQNGAFVLERKSLRAYRLHRRGEPSIEFVFHALDAAARPTRFFIPNADREFAADPEPEIRFDRTADGRLVGIIHSTGLRIAVEEDQAGRILRLDAAWADAEQRALLICGYDETGNLVAAIDAFDRRLSFEWDAANRLTRKTDHRGYSFFFEYDGQGRCVRSAGEDGTLGVALRYRPQEGVTEVTRADGGVWKYYYDSEGRQTRIVQPHGAVILRRDETGGLCGEIDPLGVALKHVRDGGGNLIAKIFPSGRRIDVEHGAEATAPTPHYHATTSVEFDYGRLPSTLPASGKSIVTRSGDRLPTPEDVPEEGDRYIPPFRCSNWYPPPGTGRQFDIFGQLVSQAGSAGRSRGWTYDPNGSVETYADFDGAVHRQEHGSWNKLIRRIDPLGNVTQFRWTTQEQLAQITDPGGCVSEYDWDQMGRLTQVRRDGVIRETYHYDQAGNLVEKRDGDGRTLFRIVATPDRLIAEKEFASGAVQRFAYDDEGRIQEIEASGVTTQFAYDAMGNRTLDQRGGRGVRQMFKGYGASLATEVLERFTIRYQRTDIGLTVSPPCGPTIQIERLGGRVFRRNCGTAVSELSRYDDSGRCILKEVSFQVGRPHVWTRKYRYSGEGDLLEISDSKFGVTRYRYDLAHRLIAANGPSISQAFLYDCAGNLTGNAASAGAIVSRRNTLVHAQGEDFAYDGRDRVVRRGEVRYEYDAQDMLVACHLPQGVWRAEYDGLGRRAKVSWGDREHAFYWDTDRLIAEIDGSGCVRIYIYADPLSLTPIAFADYASAESDPAHGRLFFVFSDQRGAPVLVTDSNGSPAWEAALEPYGSAVIQPSSSATLNLRLPGHYFDRITGLHYNRFRYYDPRLGRYLQSDPWGVSGGVNLHAYPANPLVRVDVRGLAATSCPCPTCGAVHPPEACPLQEGAFPDEPTQTSPLLNWKAGVRNHEGDVPNGPGLDMVIVGTSQGWQGFYRSEGVNSGMPGRWLPFDEVFERDTALGSEGWVNKGRFTEMNGVPKRLPDGQPNPLYRFGSEENRDLSDALGRTNIPPGERQSPAQLNRWLDDNGVPQQPHNTFRRADDDDI